MAKKTKPTVEEQIHNLTTITLQLSETVRIGFENSKKYTDESIEKFAIMVKHGFDEVASKESVERLEQRLSSRMDSLDSKVERLEKGVNYIKSDIVEIKENLTEINQRLDRIENVSIVSHELKVT